MYLDSAILVKLVVHEPDSLFYAQLLQGKSGIWVSQLCMVECYSALCRKERLGAINSSQRQKAWKKIEEFQIRAEIQFLPLTAPIVSRARQIIGQCHPGIPIRSLDAIQLACCQHSGASLLFANDQRIRRAAAFLKIPLAPIPP